MNVLKSKQLWQILAAIVIMIIAVILFFVPKAIDYKYPYSYDNLQKQKEEINTIGNLLKNNETEIQSSINNKAELEILKERKSEEEFQLRNDLLGVEFEMHIPSLLIALEQNALDNNIALNIDYNLMSVAGGQGVPGGPGEPGGPESSTNENITLREDDVISDSQGEPGDGLSTPDSYEDFDYSYEDSYSQGNDGINSSQLTIYIDGTFQNVRNYIKYIDEIGMIEPSSIKLQSDGERVSGSLSLNIFHGEVN